MKQRLFPPKNLIFKFRRKKTEFVLAKKVKGKLVEAQFDRNDLDFCFNPRISAEGNAPWLPP